MSYVCISFLWKPILSRITSNIHLWRDCKRIPLPARLTSQTNLRGGFYLIFWLLSHLEENLLPIPNTDIKTGVEQQIIPGAWDVP